MPHARTLERSVDLATPPEAVWALVSDLRRTGEWSPECRKVLVLNRGAVRRGSHIVGINRRGRFVWPTTSHVRLFEPGRAIGWTVGQSGVQWSYHVEPHGTGTCLTERREAPAGINGFATRFAEVFLGGFEPHNDELEAGIQASLERIRVLVEREPAGDGTRRDG